jgi:hypothetical protein
VPSVAEVAPSGTDPVTTQSATPVAMQGAPERGPAKEAESTESGIDRLLQEPDRPAAPPVSQTPAEPAASVARVEPASPEPSLTKPDAPAAAKEPVSKAAPSAKAPAKAGAAVAKKPGTAPAKRTVSRARRPARVQAPTAPNQGAGSNGFFGGIFTAPSAPAKATSTRRTTTQR